MPDWKSFWESKAVEGDFASSGRSSADPGQLFALLSDACAALRPEPSDRLLDLGCGIGLLSRHLALYVGILVGLDVAILLLRRARSVGPNALLVAGTMVALPFRDGAFSKILASSVLQYLKDDGAVGHALGEMRRVTAAGGRAFVSGNPDRGNREGYLAGIETLDLPAERKALIRERNQKALWLSAENVIDQAEAVGWKAEVRSISSAVWQSSYMFDVVLATS